MPKSAVNNMSTKQDMKLHNPNVSFPMTGIEFTSPYNSISITSDGHWSMFKTLEKYWTRNGVRLDTSIEHTTTGSVNINSFKKNYILEMFNVHTQPI